MPAIAHPRSNPDRPVAEQPVYWFAVLDQAIEAGDLTSAYEAQRELERLGVVVAFRLRRSRDGEVTHALR